jgi:hypothetical protein
MFPAMRQWSADFDIGAASIGFQLFPRQDAFVIALFFIEQGKI